MTTGLLTGFFALLAVFCGYMGARPPTLKHERIRLIPWRFIMFLAAVAAIILWLHILTLTGIRTDPPVRY